MSEGKSDRLLKEKEWFAGRRRHHPTFVQRHKPGNRKEKTALKTAKAGQRARTRMLKKSVGRKLTGEEIRKIKQAAQQTAGVKGI